MKAKDIAAAGLGVEEVGETGLGARALIAERQRVFPCRDSGGYALNIF
jgi:hypothetical protein